MSKKKTEKVSVFALGGAGEIGKNMYVVELDEDIFVIDAGLMFPGDEMLGIDKVIPDISYLKENKERIQGIFITHGHEDHIGALSYVLRDLKVPVYGTRLTLGLIEHKLKEAGLLKKADLRPIDAKTKLTVAGHFITFFRVNHSIPDAVGVCIQTSQGAIVHTGDFKFDYTPVDGKQADFGKIAAIGQRGVLCLLSDSTNAERPGMSGSESIVGSELNDVIYEAPGRVIVASFASNIHRLQQVFAAAEANNRKVAVVGRSMVNNVEVAQRLNYLRFKQKTLIDLSDINRLDDNQVVILTTGSQGEPMAALTRMARNAHKQVNIRLNDTVVVAASPIPGNEKSVSKTIDLLFRAGANVIYNQRKVHVSGHGHAEDLKLMLNLIKPKFFLPIHGEFRMQKAHSRLAQTVGVNANNIFIIENGDVVEFEKRKARMSRKVNAGNVLIDGIGVGDVGNIVLRDRRLLSQDGVVLCVITISRKNKTIVSGPEIISRGFVYMRESEDMINEANRIVAKQLQGKLNGELDWTEMKSLIRDKLSAYLYEQTKRRPMILPIIMEI
ncbi:Zn-dependent hydrolase [Exiguobacterium sp. Leaf187]|uniref:Ribonuclease J n=4 Tax=Exiguobacterium TaxID=33986 RepID=A0A0V8GK84_9BACL|nr:MULTISPECIES: ribonuclease J [Exiguobacterium]MBF8152599.1 ribonuclease J [Exiguobacterium sp. TBG-PICH-001]MCQ4089936.1 ribonuclease J [Exiguobacterium sp. LL15]NTY09880.1 ribonuclease J [Exiguobacterium sp. JMULE1]AHA30058.1 ribonuclease J [Exiguobacterium sp. MH3]AOT01031.1 Zn-dependent hydrolase [Exiguobacterium sp. U13-1]